MLRKIGAMAVLLLACVGLGAGSAQAQHVQTGVLTCDVSAGIGLSWYSRTARMVRTASNTSIGRLLQASDYSVNLSWLAGRVTKCVRVRLSLR